MLVTLDLPDELAQEIQANTISLPRHILEVYALQAYRSGQLNVHQIRMLLKFKSEEEIDDLLHLQENAEIPSIEDKSLKLPDLLKRDIAYPLEGTVLRYDDPFEPPISEEEWEGDQ